MEHWRVRCVRVHTIGSSGSDNFNRRLMLTGIANLHRRGMRSQRKLLAGFILHVNVERILHTAGRMIRRIIQGCKGVPVVFNFRAVGNIKADGFKDFFNAHPGSHDRMNTAVAECAARQCDIDRFRGQFTVKFFAGQSFASIIEQRFDFTFGFIDFGSASAFFFDGQFCHPLQQCCQRTVFAEIDRFRVFKGCRRCGLIKSLFGRLND